MKQRPKAAYHRTENKWRKDDNEGRNDDTQDLGRVRITQEIPVVKVKKAKKGK